MGCLLRARSVLQGQRVLALRHGPSTGAVQEETSCKDKQANWKLAVQESRQNEGLKLYFETIQKATFGSMGCLLRARSVLQGHGVLVLRHTPWTGAVQAES